MKALHWSENKLSHNGLHIHCIPNYSPNLHHLVKHWNVQNS